MHYAHGQRVDAWQRIEAPSGALITVQAWRALVRSQAITPGVAER